MSHLWGQGLGISSFDISKATSHIAYAEVGRIPTITILPSPNMLPVQSLPGFSCSLIAFFIISPFCV
jgi:hypothetical protein